MNIIFGTGLSLASALIVWALYLCVPISYRKKAKPYFWAVTIAILVYIVYTNSMTYGPRVSLQSPRMPLPPEKNNIVESNDIFDGGDRWGSFDKAFQKNKERQEQDFE